jgi:hypothetical protein
MCSHLAMYRVFLGTYLTFHPEHGSQGQSYDFSPRGYGLGTPKMKGVFFFFSLQEVGVTHSRF